MAPSKQPTVQPHAIDRTPEYAEFLAKLKEYHEKRNTTLDLEPKIGTTHVDLLQLYNLVNDHGGYDKVSEQKMKWRQMLEELGLVRDLKSIPSDSYQLKMHYYKYLAAYEISDIHKQEPPPPEILEYTNSAKGGSLLTRTLENYTGRKTSKEETVSGDEGTPGRDRKPEETPNPGRASRNLRQDPPQRVPFTPETHSSRPTRHANSSNHAPTVTPTAQAPASTSAAPHVPTSHSHSQPAAHPGQGVPRGSYSYNPSNPANYVPEVHSYVPRRPQHLPLRSVDTPSSNPEVFAKRQRMLRKPPKAQSNITWLRSTLPPDGPNIYERCLSALRSGVPQEVTWALHHLVKISFERGDKFKLSQFSGLAEGLVTQVLGVGKLFYHVDWQIAYDYTDLIDTTGFLNGEDGTPDILDKIAQLRPRPAYEFIQTAEFSDSITLCIEAALTLRNMATLSENAYWLAYDTPNFRDLACIVLALPDHDMTVELKGLILETAEQTTPFLVLDASDPLYQSLLAQLRCSHDRGTILTALRAINRIAVQSPTETNKLDCVPPVVLQYIVNWLLLNDDEIMDACLDFLYQYTAVVSNLDVLVDTVNMESLVVHLVRLLSHGAHRFSVERKLERPNQPSRVVVELPSEEVVAVPEELLVLLLTKDEPQRSYEWLRSLFEEKEDAQITQIAIWQAYNSALLEPLQQAGHKMIGAAEFIRNISHVYEKAGAQIVREGPKGEVQKFIIKGIRPRKKPIKMDEQGGTREYLRCQWARPGQSKKCGAWYLTESSLWKHVLTAHLGQNARDHDTAYFTNVENNFQCQWDMCTKYAEPTKLRLAAFMSHVKTHVMKLSTTPRDPHNPGIVVQSAMKLTVPHEETLVARDERDPHAPFQPVGIPYSATLVLRNIARNMPKTQVVTSESKTLKEERGKKWNERLYRSVRPRLFEVMTENQYLAAPVATLLSLLEAS